MFKMAWLLVLFVVPIVLLVVVGLAVIFGILGAVTAIPGNMARGAIKGIPDPMKRYPRSKS